MLPVLAYVVTFAHVASVGVCCSVFVNPRLRLLMLSLLPFMA